VLANLEELVKADFHSCNHGCKEKPFRRPTDEIDYGRDQQNSSENSTFHRRKPYLKLALQVFVFLLEWSGLPRGNESRGD
jgi:hypothetical protein